MSSKMTSAASSSSSCTMVPDGLHDPLTKVFSSMIEDSSQQSAATLRVVCKQFKYMYNSIVPKITVDLNNIKAPKQLSSFLHDKHLLKSLTICNSKESDHVGSSGFLYSTYLSTALKNRLHHITIELCSSTGTGEEEEEEGIEHMDENCYFPSLETLTIKGPCCQQHQGGSKIIDKLFKCVAHGCFPNLQSLKLSEMPDALVDMSCLWTSSSSFGKEHYTSIKSLIIQRCGEINNFPLDIFPGIMRLEVSFTKMSFSTPPSPVELPKLEKMMMVFNDWFTHLPATAKMLTHLVLCNCDSLANLDWLSQTGLSSSSSYTRISSCTNATNLQGLSFCGGLVILDALAIDRDIIFPYYSNIQHLKLLNVDIYDKLWLSGKFAGLGKVSILPGVRVLSTILRSMTSIMLSYTFTEYEEMVQFLQNI